MKPVYQTVVDKDIGNCMQAAVASLLELRLDEVPNFIDYVCEEDTSKWLLKFMDFMEAKGYEVEGTRELAPNKEETYADLREEFLIQGCIYASVKSRSFARGFHAVLINSEGIVVHDPNPSKAHLGVDVVKSEELYYWTMFVPLQVQKSPDT